MMRVIIIGIALQVLALGCCVVAISLPGTSSIRKRQANTGFYTPTTTACPSGGLVRDTITTISQEEADYIQKHLEATQSNWTSWLSSSNGPNLDADGGISGGVKAYTSNVKNLPRVAISLSGGGLRAMLTGVGYLQGLDSRNDTAVARGTGGFLQLASYVAGLSGGSWAVGSLAINNWPTVQSLQDSTYNFSVGLLANPSNATTTNNNTFQNTIGADLVAKQTAGYQVSLIDLFGQLIGPHFVSQSTTTSSNASGLQWSSIQQTDAFTSAAYPFPLITTTQYMEANKPAGGNGTIWEVNAYETGSWDKGITAFTPTTTFGSTIVNGQATTCLTGYDNFGYITALSSAIFNTYSSSAILFGAIYQSLQSTFGALTSTVVNPFPTVPNPFQQLASATMINSLQNVTFVDGGEDGQVIPLVPLVQPARAIDLILAVDSGDDTTTGWPAGYSLYATYFRFSTLTNQFGEIPMPKVPFVYTFINQGLNTRPTFFGCNSQSDVVNPGSSSSTLAPIIAYIPNYPWTYLSNVTSGAFSLTDDQSQSIIDNAVQSATLAGLGSGSIIDWPTCLACASLQRSFERSKTTIPDKCSTCMEQYCWNGDANETIPSVNFAPSVGTPQWVKDNAAKTYTAPKDGSGGGSKDGAVLSSSISKSCQALLLFLLFISTSCIFLL